LSAAVDAVDRRQRRRKPAAELIEVGRVARRVAGQPGLEQGRHVTERRVDVSGHQSRSGDAGLAQQRQRRDLALGGEVGVRPLPVRPDPPPQDQLAHVAMAIGQGDRVVGVGAAADHPGDGRHPHAVSGLLLCPERVRAGGRACSNWLMSFGGVMPSVAGGH
jgi:hypothetical protein